jgi:hypothetical protein
MESPDEVRASLAVAALADLTDHEDTSPDGEARVAGLLAEAGSLSWPLLVDGDSGLILDGSHRARVLRRDLGARFVVIQRVTLEHPAVRVAAWYRVVEGVEPQAFHSARARLGLERGAADGLACHYGGEVYGRPGVDAPAAYELARALETALGANGDAGRLRFADDDEVLMHLGAERTMVVRPPVLEKAVLRARAGSGRFPPKSTRFLVPYRVFGIDLPLPLLGGPRPAIEERLEGERHAPLVCLGDGLSVDRRYPERLWQFAGYHVPAGLFAGRAAQAAYKAARARAVAHIA